MSRAALHGVRLVVNEHTVFPVCQKLAGLRGAFAAAVSFSVTVVSY